MRSIFLAVLLLISAFARPAAAAEPLCLGGFCIGMSISDKRFDEVQWLVPEGAYYERCVDTTCRPDKFFRGMPPVAARAVALSMEHVSGYPPVGILDATNLAGLRMYRYECNPMPWGVVRGERRWTGTYLSEQSGYQTAVGLRLIDGELRVYRIVRRYPYATKAELKSLADNVRKQFGDRVLVVDYLSSNAYSDVKETRMDGWFGRSELFNPSDATDNMAELVLIDPATRDLLEPSSWPDSGAIDGIKLVVPPVCNRAMPLE